MTMDAGELEMLKGRARNARNALETGRGNFVTAMLLNGLEAEIRARTK